MTCPRCNGNREVPEFDDDGNHIGYSPCPKCGGSGEVQRDGDDPETRWTA